MEKILKDKRFQSLIGVLIVVLILVGTREWFNSQQISKLKSEIQNLASTLTERDSTIAILQEDKAKLEDELGTTLEELEEVEDEFNDLNKKTEDILELISTDEELLQKYSKVFFLNEHYSPQKLSAIDKEFWAVEDKLMDVNSKVEKHLEDLLEDAQDDDIELRVLSAYRSFGEQASLKYNYLVTYGSGANTFSADQGYSEHQLGTTVDFTTPAMGASLTTAFENTEAFAWLSENAYKYGFTMSYPKGNAYYQYEPWHWRFVSKKLARKLHRDEIGFYDMDQREIYEYLQDFWD
jgi:D-alanyl-D-alanine carboxypeptidase